MRPLVVALLLVPLAGCAHVADDGDDGPQRRYYPVASFQDVHGLAVSPDDERVLYVATHHGLVRGVEETNWSRVGRGQEDLMGFTIHPRNGSVFWTSGHGPGGNLGVRVSRDGGFTWEAIGLPGVDLHAMTVSYAKADHLWGWSSSGQLYRSRDGGSAWELLMTRNFRALAAHPVDPERVYGTSPDGLLRSVDGGASWSVVSDLQALGIAFDLTDEGRTIYAAAGSSVKKSTDGGATWAQLDADAAGGTIAHVAVSLRDPTLVYAATVQGSILRSADAGITWTTVKAR